MTTMMMIYEHAVDDSSPRSPPELTESKSSTSSSFNSFGSDDNGDLTGMSNFEDIALEVRLSARKQRCSLYLVGRCSNA
jgi:hypothetical protein